MARNKAESADRLLLGLRSSYVMLRLMSVIRKLIRQEGCVRLKIQSLAMDSNDNKHLRWERDVKMSTETFQTSPAVQSTSPLSKNAASMFISKL